jgi:lysozyme
MNTIALKIGDRGQEVERLQSFLKKIKDVPACYSLIIDGRFGAKTQQALSDYKTTKGKDPIEDLDLQIYLGLDLSHHQAQIDWKEVEKNKPKFIYLKSTEGRDHLDGKFVEYFNEIKKINSNSSQKIHIGFYHFGRPDTDSGQDDPEREARHFYDSIKSLNPDLRPVLDLEKGLKSGAYNTQWAISFSKAYKSISGNNKNLILYSAKWYFDSYMKGLSSGDVKNLKNEFPDIWLASYNSGADAERKISHWDRWIMWQKTGSGQWPGVKSNVDVNHLSAARITDLMI